MNRNWLACAGLLLLTVWLSACAPIGERPLNTEFSTRPQLGVRLRVVTGDDLPASMPLIASSQPQELLMNEPRQALLVVRVDPEKSAGRAGIQVGDYVLLLYGNDVSGMRDSVALMQALRWGDDIVVTVLREQTMQEIWVPLRQ